MSETDLCCGVVPKGDAPGFCRCGPWCACTDCGHEVGAEPDPIAVAVRAGAVRTLRPMREVDRGQHSPRVWALEWILVQGAVRGAEPRRLVDEALRLVREGVV